MLKLSQKKRGISQIDSIISVSLFVLYIIWLFIFLRSVSFSDNSSDKELLVNKFNDLKWSLNRMMIVIDSNLSEEFPVIINFPYKGLNWTYDNTLLMDSSGRNIFFIFDNNRLITLTNLTSKNYYYIIHSKKQYNKSNNQQFKQIICDKSFVSTQSTRVNLKNALIKNVSFRTNIIIKDFNLIINNKTFYPINTSFINYNIISYHKSIGNNFNNTCYAFGLQNKLFCFIDSEQNLLHQINLTFLLTGLSGYYSDNSNNGIFSQLDKNTSNKNKCDNYKNDYIQFFDNNKKIQIEFLFSKEMNLTLCDYNNSVQFFISGEFNKSFSDYIFLDDYDGNITKTKSYAINHKFGVLEKLTALDYDLITDQAVLNNLFNLGNKGGVSVFVNNKLYSAGNKTPDFTNVYAKTFIKEVLLKNGSFEDCKISIKTW